MDHPDPAVSADVCRCHIIRCFEAGGTPFDAHLACALDHLLHRPAQVPDALSHLHRAAQVSAAGPDWDPARVLGLADRIRALLHTCSAEALSDLDACTAPYLSADKDERP